jgi:hypothetical protein
MTISEKDVAEQEIEEEERRCYSDVCPHPANGERWSLEQTTLSGSMFPWCNGALCHLGISYLGAPQRESSSMPETTV